MTGIPGRPIGHRVFEGRVTGLDPLLVYLEDGIRIVWPHGANNQVVCSIGLLHSFVHNYRLFAGALAMNNQVACIVPQFANGSRPYEKFLTSKFLFRSGDLLFGVQTPTDR